MACIELEIIITEPIVLVATTECNPVVGGVSSVNGKTGIVVLDSDDISEGTTNLYITVSEKANLANQSGTNTGDQDLSGLVEKVAGYGLSQEDYTTAEKSKLLNIEAGAEVNNISDINATDLTDGGETTLHRHSAGPTIDITATNIINPRLGNFFSTVLSADLTLGFTNLQENDIFFLKIKGAHAINPFTLAGYTFVPKKYSDPDEYQDGLSTLCGQVVKVTTGSDGIIEYFWSNNQA